LYSKIWVIPFENKPKRADSNLREMLKAEVSQFIQVCLSLPLPLLDDIVMGRGEGEMHDAKYHAWKITIGGCSVGQFVDAMLIPDANSLESASILFKTYMEWAKEQNISSPGSQTFFSTRLKLRLDNLRSSFWYKKDKISVVVWKGYQLRKEGEFSTPTIAEMLKEDSKPSLTGDLEATRESIREGLNLDTVSLREGREGFSPNLREEKKQECVENFSQPVEKTETEEAETIPTLPQPEPASVTTLPEKEPRESLTLPEQWERFNQKFPYPNPKSDNVQASQKRMSKIREAARAARTKEDLSALRRENGGQYSFEELKWVQSFLKNFYPTEYNHLIATGKITQPTIPGIES
jgi:hypothetical protein